MLGVAFVVAVVLFVAPPVIWVAWWLLADLGQMSRGGETNTPVTSRRRIPAG